MNEREGNALKILKGLKAQLEKEKHIADDLAVAACDKGDDFLMLKLAISSTLFEAILKKLSEEMTRAELD